MQRAAGAGDGHVEAALTAGEVERAEVHGDGAAGISPVGGGEVNDTTLITLHVFEVFHENGFGVGLREVGFERFIRSAGGLQ